MKYVGLIIGLLLGIVLGRFVMPGNQNAVLSSGKQPVESQTQKSMGQDSADKQGMLIRQGVLDWKAKAEKGFEKSENIGAFKRTLQSHWLDLAGVLDIPAKSLRLGALENNQVILERKASLADETPRSAPSQERIQTGLESEIPQAGFPKAVEYFSESTSRELSKKELEDLRADNFFDHMKAANPLTEKRIKNLLGYYQGTLVYEGKRERTYALKIEEVEMSFDEVEILSKEERRGYKFSVSFTDFKGKDELVLEHEVLKKTLLSNNDFQSYDQGKLKTVIFKSGAYEVWHLFLNENDLSHLQGIVYKKVAVDYIEPIGTITLTRVQP